MRILITGGAGCLGSNLIEHWLPKGHEILVVDNFATGKRELVPELPGLMLRAGTVADADFVDNCFFEFKPRAVIHAAASYKNPDDWHEDQATNIEGSINVARSAIKHECEKVINFQTALCYGRPERLPVPVDHRLAPFTSYGISKTAGEQYMLLSGVPLLSLRIANVTGPRLAIGPIPSFYKRLKAGQSCFCSSTARDFLDMRDFLDFMDLAILPESELGIFNLSSGDSHTIKEIYDLVSLYLGMPPADIAISPPGDDDVPVMVLDPSQTERAFGWRAKWSFAEMIDEQLRWYDRYGVSDIYSHLRAVPAK